MAKKSSKASGKKSQKDDAAPAKKSAVKTVVNFTTSPFRRLKKRFKTWRSEHVNPHKNFRRSYREDYQRRLEIPGIMYHTFTTFKLIFKNWRLFLPLLLLAVVLNMLLVGMMSESTYTDFQSVLDETISSANGVEFNNVARAGLLLVSSITTGGLSMESSESSIVFMVIIFLILWLTTIYLLRQRLAGHKVKLRDGLYNAMTPLISTFVVFAIAVIECVPIFVLAVVDSAAVQTEFLATPFYALVFFIFAAAMILLSGYLLSSSLIALVAVTAPGLYPMRAISGAVDLVMGRRIRFILRLLSLCLVMVIVWLLVMLPLILLDLGIKQFDWAEGIPFVPFCLNVMTCFTIIYVAAYLYLYYRWLLGNDEKEDKVKATKI